MPRGACSATEAIRAGDRDHRSSHYARYNVLVFRSDDGHRMNVGDLVCMSQHAWVYDFNAIENQMKLRLNDPASGVHIVVGTATSLNRARIKFLPVMSPIGEIYWVMTADVQKVS